MQKPGMFQSVTEAVVYGLTVLCVSLIIVYTVMLLIFGPGVLTVSIL